MPTRLRYNIHDWDVLRRRGEWPLLLVGNGASCAVSDKFAYKRLLNVANLSADDLAVFRALKTANFESVLGWFNEYAVHFRNDHAHPKQATAVAPGQAERLVRSVHQMIYDLYLAR